MAEEARLDVRKPAAVSDPNDVRAEARRVARLTKHERKLRELAAAKLEQEVEALKLRNAVLTQEVSRLWWDKYTRLAACAAIFAIVIGWLAVVGVLLLQAESKRSDAVLVAALGTTTVNVLGLLYIVTRYLFPIPSGKAPPADPSAAA